jgi:hypothetical protein
MLYMVEEHSAANSLKVGTHNKLDTYLGVGLKKIEDIVGW